MGHTFSLNRTGLLLILPEAKPIYPQWTVVRESTRLQARKAGSWFAKHQNFPHGFQARVLKDNPEGEGGLPRWLSDEESAANAKDMNLIPGLKRSPREGNGNPFQYSCLGNPMDRVACGLQSMGWQKSRTRLSD